MAAKREGWWWCSVCKTWTFLKANGPDQAMWEHRHAGTIGYMDQMESADGVWNGVGYAPWRTRPMPDGSIPPDATWVNKWRIVHTGYSQGDSWGHEAGGWVHVHERVVRRDGGGSLRGSRAEVEEWAGLLNSASSGLEVQIEPDVECGASGYM